MSYRGDPSPTWFPQSHRIDSPALDAGHKSKTTDSEVYRVGVYGWRKRCLYALIVLLTIIIIMNLAITIWIMKVLHLTFSGMGSMQVLDNGIRVLGRSEFDRPVHLRDISTAEGVPLSLNSDRGLMLNARNSTGDITSSITLTQDGRIQAVCDRFEIRNAERQLIFFTDKDEVAFKVDNMRIIDEGGSVFEGSIQTEIIRPEPGNALKLESPTRGLHVDAAQDIEILSRAGEIMATALLDISIQAGTEISIDTPNLFVKGLREGGRGEGQSQLCVCENGRLFRVNNGADCRANDSICNPKK